MIALFLIAIYKLKLKGRGIAIFINIKIILVNY